MIAALAFITSPLGRILGIGVIALLVLGYGYHAGVTAERERGEAAQLRAELETIRLDKTLAEQALISARSKEVELAQEVEQNEEALDALRNALAARPETDRCPAAPADLDLLYQ